MLSNAHLLFNGEKVALELTEDIEQIAFKSLEDRMFREIGKSVARLVLKRAAEIVATNQNKNAGFVLSALNAMTERADTRNWQSLPHSIYYQRVSLSVGSQDLKLVTSGKAIVEENLKFKVQIKKNVSTFRTFHSLESTLPLEQ